MGSRNVSPLEVAPRADRELGRELRERLLPMLVWAGLAYLGALGLHGILLSGAAWWEVARRTLNVAFSVTAAGLFLIRHPVLGSRAGHWRRSWPSPAPSRRCSSPPRHPHTPGARRTGAQRRVSLAGIAWALLALAGLGRCFGLFPEARGQVTHGCIASCATRLYFGEIVFMLGLALPLLSPTVVLLLAGWIGCRSGGRRTKSERCSPSSPSTAPTDRAPGA